MIGRVSGTYAFRSLFRHPRRSILSMVGVGIGCAMGLLATSWTGGAGEMQIRAASESGAGHIRVVPAGWMRTRENSLRLVAWEQTLEEVRSVPGVEAVAMRSRASGLLAFGNRTVGVEITGVEPDAEMRSNRIVRLGSLRGRYLSAGDRGKVVIGRQIATRLDVDVDDDLYVTLAGRDEIRSAMLTIVGIIETGSRDVDASICHVNLGDVEELTGYKGPAEISILLEHHGLIAAAQKELARKLGGRNEVITWEDVNPALAANVRGDRAFMDVLVFIVVVVVGLGVAGAQLTAVLERRREFAVLSALGMKGGQVVGLVMLEALLIGLGGAAVSLLLGGPIAYWLATRGVSIAHMMGDEYSIADVLLDPIIYGTFGIWLVWYALGVSVTATVAASIYPAWLATRAQPADAMRMV